jgi:hypothetical protein
MRNLPTVALHLLDMILISRCVKLNLLLDIVICKESSVDFVGACALISSEPLPQVRCSQLLLAKSSRFVEQLV